MTDQDSDEYVDINLRSPSDVAARAIVLATVTRRGIIEVVPNDDEAPEATRFDLAAWLRIHLDAALEFAEAALLDVPTGSLSEAQLATCLDAGGALVALNWCLSVDSSALPEPNAPANLEPLLQALPQPWQDPKSFLFSAVLRAEEEIALERERAEIWWWRASIFPEDLRDIDTRTAIEAVAIEAAATNLISTINADLALAGRAFAKHDEATRANVLSIATVRLRALNWVCGFGTTWADVPLDIS